MSDSVAPYSMCIGSVSARVQKENIIYLHFDLKFWALLIANGDHIEKCGRFGHLALIKILLIGVSMYGFA